MLPLASPLPPTPSPACAGGDAAGPPQLLLRGFAAEPGWDFEAAPSGPHLLLLIFGV